MDILTTDPDEKEFTCKLLISVKLTNSDMARIHDCILEATGKTSTARECIETLQRHPEILRKIIYLGEAETEVGDDLYEALKKEQVNKRQEATNYALGLNYGTSKSISES